KVSDPLGKDGVSGCGSQRGKPLEVDQALLGELLSSSCQLRWPRPGRHDQGDRQRDQPAADEPEEGERVGVRPMGVVERNQKWPHRDFPQPMQDGIEAVGCWLVGPSIAVYGMKDLHA